MTYLCCDERRRRAVREHPTLNGIDSLEVLDTEAPSGSPRQRTLLLRFVKPAPALTAVNFEITGGVRILDIGILWTTPADAPDAALTTAAERAWLAALPAPEEMIALRTESSGDYATYTLHLLAAAGGLAPPPGIDPMLARIDFSFKVECPSDFDCAADDRCGAFPEPPPRISYLAKDYRSFRRLMLDRMAQTLPGWQERNAADLGIALVEVLAYVGDRLSYAQDAVATEAYLGTARRRVSVRRHARLVDHALHDGASARAWVQVRVKGAPLDLPAAETKFLTAVTGAGAVIPPPSADTLFGRLLAQQPVVFEPLEDKRLFEPLNEIFFHEWGEGGCCLPRGATRATLQGDLPMLAAGDILVFEEILGPRSGSPADADPQKRHAVRLVQVAAGQQDPLGQPPEPVTEIRWAEGDALPFPLCLSALVEGVMVRRISRALGNILLADHGLTRRGVPLGQVPQPHLVLATGEEHCATAERVAVPPRFLPLLPEGPVTQAAPPPGPATPASAVLVPPLASLRPQVRPWREVQGGPPEAWEARSDLLSSGPTDRHVAVEVEDDGRAQLRFGDGRHGDRPAAGSIFTVDFRIGNGPGGNIGADALAHVVSGLGGIEGVRNPLPARGGRPQESVGEARVAAPQAFRVQQRAVTPEDYAAIALRHPAVQRAAATFRWNGHGHTVFVTVDRFGGRPVTAEFEAELIAFLDPFRMAGYDLEIDEPRYVALEIELLICARPGALRSEVKRAVLQALDDSGDGFFHPDRLSFAQNIYLSAIVSCAQAVEGVESVTPLVFRRLGSRDPAPLENGILTIGRLEIARLANDPSLPEHGVLTLRMGGGR